MAKKKQELFIDINTQRDFNYILDHNKDQLICIEVYCSFAGPCTALDRLFITMKYDWSDGQLILLRVLADEVEALSRFRDQSQPVYLFILNKKIIASFRGVDNIKFAEVARKEIQLYKQGNVIEGRGYNIDEASPEDIECQEKQNIEKEEEEKTIASQIAARQAERKRHRAELMVPHLRHLNFVLFWPHCIHAHHELYERWDLNNIIMVGREEIQLTEELALDILYDGDAPINEASIHMLLSAPALAICFRLLDVDKHFVSLARKILYEEIPPIDPAKKPDEQPPQKTAFDMYKMYSPTREAIFQRRREQLQKMKEESLYKRARRLSEVQRLARQAIEEAKVERQMRKEQRKLEILKIGVTSILLNTNGFLCKAYVSVYHKGHQMVSK
ncbi:uncharacterized protein LOC126977875 [Leptidea sinapis]|uniref:uncharacterized protein LOC126977875 n=1 Tax=Leptidea sinapis TaxID=189913 RepID=UPI0021C3B4AB|nr:uncharacterized protein LOC126977875 [Leptidea sinapis]